LLSLRSGPRYLGEAAGLGLGDAVFAAGVFLAVGFGPPPVVPTISTCVILTAFCGELFCGSHGPALHGIRAIFFTNSTVASSHWPKMV